MFLTDDEKILALRNIEGLDVDSGLKNVMNMVAVYFKILRVFVKNERNDKERFDRMINLDEISDFNVMVHGYKSSLKNIGATYLSELALQLEMYAKNSDVARIEENLPAFKDKLAAFADNLEKILG
ncbi:MAG: hypothetical protein FWD48_00380 [Oscillospiraceae bacterium]|nr:hypothetical protein [Oscillospiraceae bacterium]